MRHTEEFTVDDTTYRTTHYAATVANKLLTRIARIVGPGFATLGVAGMDAEVTPDLIGTAVSSLLAQTDESDMDDLLKKIISTTQIIDSNGNRPIIFDTDFAGKIGHLYKVVKEVLSFQYSDFLAAIVELLGQGSAAIKMQQNPANRIKAKA